MNHYVRYLDTALGRPRGIFGGHRRDRQGALGPQRGPAIQYVESGSSPTGGQAFRRRPLFSPVRRTRRNGPEKDRWKMDRLHLFARYASDHETPQGLYDAFVKLGPLPRYWEDGGGVRDYDSAQKEAQTIYIAARQYAIRLRKAQPDLPPLPPTETDPFLGLQSIQDWCIDAGSKQRAPGTPAGKRKRRRRKTPQNPRPITAKQTEAMQIVGECQGNLAEAARRIGINPKSLRERYDAACKKLGRKAVKAMTKSFPKDRRGQEDVASSDDGPGSLRDNPHVRRDRRGG